MYIDRKSLFECVSIEVNMNGKKIYKCKALYKSIQAKKKCKAPCMYYILLKKSLYKIQNATNIRSISYAGISIIFQSKVPKLFCKISDSHLVCKLKVKGWHW